MFKAIDRRSREEIVILDARWRERVAQLRALATQDVLVCQGCEQPVRVRTGKVRRWHFAHKHLENCSYGYELPTLLQIRGVLYEWLVGHFGGEVAIERKVDDVRFPRPVDCWVETGRASFAYWIIESRTMPQVREELRAGAAQLNAQMNWVLASEMLRPDADIADQVHLTTTEREFIQPSEYDEIAWATHACGLGSLHYLDPDERTVTTYRGLYPHSLPAALCRPPGKPCAVGHAGFSGNR
jgi:hypothetical protein